jgi:hypothetical protein
VAHYLPFCVSLSLSLLLWAQMPYGLAVSAVALLFGAGFLFGAAGACRDGDRAISSFSAYASLGAIDATETSRPGRFDRDLDLEP